MVALGKSSGLDELTKDSYLAAITYLKANEKFVPGVCVMATDNEMLRQLASAMGMSRPKESTLDFRTSQELAGDEMQLSSNTLASEIEFDAALEKLSVALERPGLEKAPRSHESTTDRNRNTPETPRWPSFELD
jgi:hypothetical protein